MVVPKLVAYRILEPALQLPEPILLDCVHERPERLVAELAIFSLDLVLADTPAPPAVKVRAYSHLLGECGVSVLASGRIAPRYRPRFPRSLDGAPFLLPSGDSGLRLSLEEWFRKQGIRPRVVGTFEDSALIDAFGRAGAGLLAVPSAIEAEVRLQYGLRLVGRLESVRQRFYAITVDRKLRNPATIAISERARALFA
jgi:LysR family transcriptional activator of nhaA